MGYPYNWEPLNFFRSALMGICCSFAVCELLAFRARLQVRALILYVNISRACFMMDGWARLQYIDCAAEAAADGLESDPADCPLSGLSVAPKDAVVAWSHSVIAIGVFYTVAFLLRLRVFRQDRRAVEAATAAMDEDNLQQKQQRPPTYGCVYN